MKTKTTYICEICGAQSVSKEITEKCEAQGRLHAERACVGMVFHVPSRPDWVFAVVGLNYEKRTHDLITDVKSYRPFQESFCGATFDMKISGKTLMIPDLSLPIVRAIIESLQTDNMPVSLWDGEKAVPYTEPT